MNQLFLVAGQHTFSVPHREEPLGERESGFNEAKNQHGLERFALRLQ
jgi:hypothetical protein